MFHEFGNTLTPTNIHYLYMLIFSIIRSLSLFVVVNTLMTCRKKFISLLYLLVLIFSNFLSFCFLYPDVYTQYISISSLIVSIIYYYINIKDKSYLNLICLLSTCFLTSSLATALDLVDFLYTGVTEESLFYSSLFFSHSHQLRCFFDSLLSMILSIYFILKKRNIHTKKELVISRLTFVLLITYTFIQASYPIILNILDYPSIIRSILCLIILFLFYEHMKMTFQNKLETVKIETEKEKHLRIYKNYRHELDKFTRLKHDIVSKLKDISNESVEEYLTTIDELITPVIKSYSENEFLNSILIEKSLLLEELKITHSFTIRSDLTFLSENDLILIFSHIINQILEVNDLTTLEIDVTSDLNNHSIIYSFDSKEVELDSLWLSNEYKRLIDKYSIIYSTLNNDSRMLYCINLTYQKGSD